MGLETHATKQNRRSAGLRRLTSGNGLCAVGAVTHAGLGGYFFSGLVSSTIT